MSKFLLRKLVKTGNFFWKLAYKYKCNTSQKRTIQIIDMNESERTWADVNEIIIQIIHWPAYLIKAILTQHYTDRWFASVSLRAKTGSTIICLLLLEKTAVTLCDTYWVGPNYAYKQIKSLAALFYVLHSLYIFITKTYPTQLRF